MSGLSGSLRHFGSRSVPVVECEVLAGFSLPLSCQFFVELPKLLLGEIISSSLVLKSTKIEE